MDRRRRVRPHPAPLADPTRVLASGAVTPAPTHPSAHSVAGAIVPRATAWCPRYSRRARREDELIGGMRSQCHVNGFEATLHGSIARVEKVHEHRAVIAAYPLHEDRIALRDDRRQSSVSGRNAMP